MEIPIEVMRLGIGHGLDRALKRLLDGLLVTLLVDEIDEPDFVVDPGLLGEVEPKRGYLVELMSLRTWTADQGKPTHRLGHVHDLQIRLVPQIIDLCPKDRHAPPNLDKTQPLPPLDPPGATHMHRRRRIDGIKQHQLLGLVVIRRMARRVDTARKVSRARAVAGSTGDEAEEEAAVVDA